jgi:hypothetical protein
MNVRSISSHLRPYIMLSRRRTTINHAFAAAVASSDIYDEALVCEALEVLGIDPKRELTCAYCGELAETWDHIFATVKDSQFSGYGHRLGNLLPCCKSCNSRKGNRQWDAYLKSLELDPTEYGRRSGAISRFLDKYGDRDDVPIDSPDLLRRHAIRRQILALLEEGDQVAARVRSG